MHFRAEVSSNDIGITDETTSDPQPLVLKLMLGCDLAA